MTEKLRTRVVLPTPLFGVALLIVLAVSTVGFGSDTGSPAAALPPPSNGAISPQNQADALHFVIAADREAYCRMYIARQSENGPLSGTSVNGKSRESLPLPSEIFRRASESIQSQGAEFSYSLRSLRPIDPRNEPQTELEQRGLAYVASHPAQNYYGNETLGGRRYFTAVYPDLPAVAACVECHHRRAPSLRYRVGESMGGIVVRVPLEF